MSMYSEIRSDYSYGLLAGDLADDDAILTTCIDAWETPDDDAPGIVVAKVVLTKHGDIAVVWIENGARMDEETLAVIRETVDDMRFIWENSSIKKNYEKYSCGQPSKQ